MNKIASHSPPILSAVPNKGAGSLVLAIFQRFIACGMFFSLACMLWGQPLDSLDVWRKQAEQGTEEVQARAFYQLFNFQYQNAQPQDSILKYGRGFLEAAVAEGPMEEAKKWGVEAVLFQVQADYDQAVASFLQALEAAQAEGELAYIAYYASGLAGIYVELRDYEKAKKYYLLSLEAKVEDGDEEALPSTYNNLAGMYRRLGQNDSAIYYIQAARQLYRERGEVKFLPSVYNSLGTIYLQDPALADSATYFFEVALEWALELGQQENELVTRNNLAYLYFAAGDFEAALAECKANLRIARALQKARYEYLMLGSIGECLAELGRYREAYTHLLAHNQLKDSLLNAETRMEIEQLEAQYDATRKDLKIERLRVAEQEKDLALAEQERRQYLILVIGVVVLTLLGGLLWVLWQRKRNQEALEREKERFFSNVVHEFRTPIALIKGPLEQIRRAKGRAGWEENLDYIDRNSDRLLRLVNQLLDVSKLEGGQYRLERSIGRPLELVLGIAKEFEAAAAQVDFRVEVSGEDRVVNYPGDVLEKVTWNLLSNALKFSAPGDRVVLRAKVVEGPDQWLLNLEVEDTGPGISREEQRQLFTRFYQGRAGTAASVGTGIGLALSRELAELAGGSLVCKSELAAGAVFTLELPVEVAGKGAKSDEDGAVFSKSSASPNEPREEPSKKTDPKPRVLLVEDDPDLGAFLSQVLQSEGYEVELQTNGAQGLEAARTNLPDLILSDVMMPEMDGLEMLAKLKSEPLTQHIPVLLLSAKASPPSRKAGLGQGAEVYLTKPFDPAELLLLMRSKLENLKAQQQRFQQQLKKGKAFADRLATQDLFLQKIITHTLNSMGEEGGTTVEGLASHLALSRSQVHRKIKALTGLSTTAYLRVIRLEKAAELLDQNAGNVSQVAYATGFSSQPYFSKSFHQHFGYPPSKRPPA